MYKPSKLPLKLTPDRLVPSIKSAEGSGDDVLKSSRKVDGSFTYLKPTQFSQYDLKFVSPTGLSELNISLDKEFEQILTGEKVFTSSTIYPFASNYAGHQFGQWAGQLGDGRALTLFNVNGYDLQLKGAGLTPYSRFGDGLAILGSSIRETLCSIYLHSLKIPTQQALSLTLLPTTFARRHKIEKCAVVCRFAKSFIRIGNFELHHTRQNREELVRLSELCLELLNENKVNYINETTRGNKFYHLFRECSLRNAYMLARCAAYGFLNGVLNTDNVSILGLSIDYGPFAFMDVFDPNFTPNKDDHLNRYGFKTAPMAMWWNCVKLGECLGELMGTNNLQEYISSGTKKEDQEQVAQIASDLIMSTLEEFQFVYEHEYHRLMMQRIGFFKTKEGDEQLIEEMLEVLHDCKLDYNSFFRKLSLSAPVRSYVPQNEGNLSSVEIEQRVSKWLQKYQKRLNEEPNDMRKEQMLLINPKFVLRNEVMENVAELANLGNWDAFNAVAEMVADPFKEKFDVDEMYEKRYCVDEGSEVNTQMSCSS